MSDNRLIRHRRIRPMTATETAYLAGIIDGEGCISFRKRGRLIFPIVAITNTSEVLIEWLQGLCVRRPRRLVASRSTKKTAWQVEWSAVEDVRCLLREVLPYLRIKRDKAACALLILDTRYG